MATRHVLCTGGAGYIGSHTVIHLMKNNFEVTILDNFSNTSRVVVERLEKICGKKIPLLAVDLRDEQAMTKVFKENRFDAVIHYAGLKAVAESVEKPLEYYENNIGGTLNLLKVMGAVGCKVIVFSSSATVYKPNSNFIVETDPLGPCNPYGQTKLFLEQILQDLYASDNTWKISILRYFNPIGAHESGTIGESPEYPNNLLPYIQQVAVGRRPHLNVFGNDWPTVDGTGVRDYLHVEDLAEGHVAALQKLVKNDEGCCIIHNLGTGKGTSVLELLHTFEKACGKTLSYKCVERRPGDLGSVIANPENAAKDLGWKATRSIELGCQSAWKWQSQNPYGYDSQQNESK